jgi:hypothetical protein
MSTEREAFETWLPTAGWTDPWAHIVAWRAWQAALAQPAVPEPMTREFCAAFPGTAAGIINELARQIDAAQEKP